VRGRGCLSWGGGGARWSLWIVEGVGVRGGKEKEEEKEGVRAFVTALNIVL